MMIGGASAAYVGAHLPGRGALGVVAAILDAFSCVQNLRAVGGYLWASNGNKIVEFFWCNQFLFSHNPYRIVYSIYRWKI